MDLFNDINLVIIELLPSPDTRNLLRCNKKLYYAQIKILHRLLILIH